MSRGNVRLFKARGLMPPVYTPLNKDLTINYGLIPTYAKYLTDNGIKSVLVGGTAGEHMTLCVADRKRVIDQWVEFSKGTDLNLQVQVGGAPLADVVDLAKYCESVGVDSLLTLPELYFKPQSVAELVSYIELVANAAPTLPVLYYHIPSRTNVDVNMKAFVTEASARIPNFKGLKYTTNDLNEAAQISRILKDDQEIFVGGDTLLAPASLLGLNSFIGSSFNLFPNQVKGVLQAVKQGDLVTARTMQTKLSMAIEAISVEGAWVPAMKAGMEIVTGMKVGPPSLPQKPLSEESRKRIEGKLKGLGLM